MLDLIDGVNRDMLQDWLNKIRLWTIRADFLAWTGKLDQAEDLARIGLATIEARSEEDRRQCRLEEIKLRIRRGIPSANRREFEKAHDYFKKAEPLLLAYQKTIRANRETSEAERLSVVEQELILKNNLGLVYLNLALKQRKEAREGKEAQENALKAKEAFESGFGDARAQAYTNRSYRNYLNHLAAWLELQLARYYEQWEGDYERAAASYGSALSTLKEIGASSAAVNCANSMAVCLAGADHFDEALKYAEESRRLAEELRDWEGVAMAYATLSCDVYLAQAKKAGDSSREEEFITKARKAFDLSWDHGHKIESADLLYAWQLILTDLMNLQGEQADPELQQKLECVEKSIMMLGSAD
jgi:tetratricopeptide (TPR) repeat protein